MITKWSPSDHDNLVLKINGWKSPQIRSNSLFYICVDITVRFNQSTYNVNENSGIIQLFLILSSPSSFNETVQLISTNVDTDDAAIGMINHQNIVMFEYNVCFII